MADRSALVAGATGLVGSHCLSQLLRDPAYARVVALTRRPVGPDPKLESRIVDFDRLAAPDVPRVDDVYCALGTTIRAAGSQEAFRRVDYDYVMTLARLAVGAGARQFLLVSAVGANPRSAVFYTRVKGEVERDVAALPFRAVHLFRPSFLVGARAEHRTGERIGIAVFRAAMPLLVGPLRRYRPVAAETVARAMRAAAARDATGVWRHESETLAALAAAVAGI